MILAKHRHRTAKTQGVFGGAVEMHVLEEIILDGDGVFEAMKSGAFDYVLKPLDFHQLLPQIERAIEHRRLAMELKSLRRNKSRSWL